MTASRRRPLQWITATALLTGAWCYVQLAAVSVEQATATPPTATDAETPIAEKSMAIAGEICIYTNANIIVEEL